MPVRGSTNSGTTKSGTAYWQYNTDRGGPDAPQLILIHGLGLCSEIWRDHLPLLAERFDVVTYDLYGHGESGPAPETPSLALYARQVAELLDHLDIAAAHIVGFSIGGMINRRLAMDFPEKCQSLVILNSPHDRGEEAQQAVEARALKVREHGPMATLEDALTRWFTPSYLMLSAARTEEVRQWREKVEPESYAGAAWVLAHGVRELIKPASTISLPALVMTAENDAGSTPKMSHDIAAEIVNAKTLIVPGLQHLGLMEAPEAFARPIVEFLESIQT